MDVVTTLSVGQKLSFSVGHFYNDLCSAMWFTYLLIFFTNVVGMSNSSAGYLLLLGQVIDAVSTPLLGYESDATDGFFGYGKRKTWHLLGTLFVTISFAFLFLPCFGGSHSVDAAKLIYYSPFIMAFQFGWAAVQIAHMTLVTELTPDESERVGLNSYRNAMTLFANVTVYGIAWMLFHKESDAQWGPNDTFQFMILMLCVISIGLVCSIVFHIFTKEKKQTHQSMMQVQVEDRVQKMKWWDWFKEPQFYLVWASYMAARLISNVSQTYWPFYIMDSLSLSKQYAAIIPLVVFVSGFFTSLTMKPVNSLIGRKACFAVGSLISGAALTWMGFLEETSMQVFGCAILIGVGSTTLLVTALSMISDVIGEHTNTSAFVYGVMSFGDKLSSGVVLMIIQVLEPTCPTQGGLSGLHCVKTRAFFYDIMVFVLAGFTGACFLMCIVLVPFKLGSLRKFSSPDELESDEQRDYVSEHAPLIA